MDQHSPTLWPACLVTWRNPLMKKPSPTPEGTSEGQPKPSPAPTPSQTLQQLIIRAIQEFEDYQRLTSQGKLGEAGQKLEQHKRTLEEIRKLGSK